MKKNIAITFIVCCVFACRYQQPELSAAELKEKLQQTMTEFLYKGVKNDSSVVKYHVLDVTYYNAPLVYDCEFKVNMKERNMDTIGIMKARISKDWQKVVRVY